MQTPAQIEVESAENSPKLQAAINQRIAELETRFGRVTAGRVVVKGPSDRHETGGQYQVSIWLALPNGREVNIGRTPKEDERYADLTFALDEAFKRARRQLQDQARIMRGDVKHHAQSGTG
ncbi:MAG TPA: HPF/RaiA family ribosome-associated protein [Bradyrhizobium sp.]|uniref:HPF/RaiA family ribosome-associated protein n=1 Tax=Bradyrhizobium sp. TaxID=376 RepID=UPI002C132A2E|nr:HPF/RaiA family ribosome-associated protein [Bradyrhizobium sp.]HLZ01086.1 HPF/RaiA family ribosome-associated protein [Bradyrhizobium sp.]